MTDKKNDDLGLDEKLADDLIDDIDDIENLDDLDEIDDLSDIDGDFDDLDDLEDLDDLDELDETESDNESDDAPDKDKDIEELDKEITSLNDELDQLEDDNLETDDLSDEDELNDDNDSEEFDEKEDDTEEDNDIDAIEEKERKKKELIMKGATGAFVLMVGGFMYNLMFAGELPSEQNAIPVVNHEQQIITAPPISMDMATNSLDKTFEGFEIKASDAGIVPNNESDAGLALKDEYKNPPTSNEDIDVVDDNYTNLKLSETDTSKKEKKELNNNQSINPNSDLDLDKALYERLIKDLSKAQGVHISEQGQIIGQDNFTTYELRTGQTIPYYSYSVDVVSIFFDNKLALLSNGTYIDNNRAKVDENLVKMAGVQKELENKEVELREKRAQAEQERTLRIAEERAREEERLKSKEQQQIQAENLRKALERINSLTSEVENKKQEEVAAPRPRLLEGWSINGEFKALRNGYVLNGYLVRDSDGNFYKMLVGDTHEEFGLIRGYDGNGRFFIGNSYIL